MVSIGIESPLGEKFSAPLISDRPLEDMDRMRKEIRQLQEKRAAAMMNEVVEMQRERDMMVGSIKILKQTLEDVMLENAVLKESVGHGDQVKRLFHLEKNFLEEQLYSSDLKKKLQNANKQILVYKSKITSMELQRNNFNPFLSVGQDSNLEQNQNTNDVEQELDEQKSNEGASPYHLTRINPKQRDSTKADTESLNVPLINSQLYNSSTTIIPRRYKLATTQQRSVGTQVNLLDSKSITNSDTKSESEEITTQQQAIETLQLEKKELENNLSEMNAQREKESEELKLQKNSYKNLQTESNVLRDGLSEFSLWVRQKMQLVEEDIDVCRVIYSLHGSLSQEAALLRDMQNRLGNSEQKIAHLETTNRQLVGKLTLAEERYKREKHQNRLLKEKIILLKPNKSSKQSFYTPPLTSSPKPHRNPNLRPHFPHFTSSPLLHHHSTISTSTSATSRETVQQSKEATTLYSADIDVV